SRIAPTISAQERSLIESRYRQERLNPWAEKQRLQSQFNVQVASTRQHFGDIQQSLNQEEQQFRATNLQKRNRTSQECDSRLATVDLDIVAARNEAAPTIHELSEKLGAAQKQVFAVRWKAAKHSSEGRRFARLRFRDYLRKV